MISTHNGVDNAFNQLIQKPEKAGKITASTVSPWMRRFRKGCISAFCYVTGQTWSPEAEQKWRDGLYKNAPNKECADEEYGCVPKKSGGAYLSRVFD